MRRLGLNGNGQIIAEDGWSLLPMTQRMPKAYLAMGRGHTALTFKRRFFEIQFS
jgi:hypothetical protein